MTCQKPSPNYDDASPLSLLRYEEAVAKKKKLLTAWLEEVVGGEHSVFIAPSVATNGGSTEIIVDLSVGVDKPFGTCYTPDGMLNR